MRASTIIRCAVAAVIGAAPLVAVAQDPRPCTFFSAAEVASVTGTAPGRGQPDGPDSKEFPGATTWTCVWMAGERVFATRVLLFASAAEATRAMTSNAEHLKGFPEGLQLAAVPGPGDQALWGASSEEGAVWIVRSGRRLFTVFVAGEVPKAEGLREPLRKLAAAGLAKLP